ncbi:MULTISPECIES: hemerythrin domain-containing protein [unclassified Streptomyces]|uniref:hemerythrin domain-containing protein n=1 Tax=unclassified Streptomyces TaxID=2593676 RepID=UPI00336A6AF7
MPQQHDVVDLLTSDHHEVQELFEGYRASVDPGERRLLVERITVEIVRHSVAEEQYLYPTVRKALPNGDEVAEREIEELAEAERILGDLERTDTADRRFDALVRELYDVVSMHIRGEEDVIFPELRERLTAEERLALGLRVGEAKAITPAQPYPGRSQGGEAQGSATQNPSPGNPSSGGGAGEGVSMERPLTQRVREWLSGPS